jgi:hypothetical protein
MGVLEGHEFARVENFQRTELAQFQMTVRVMHFLTNDIT